MTDPAAPNHPVSALFEIFAKAHKALTTLPEDDTTRRLSAYLLDRSRALAALPFPDEGKRATLLAWAQAVGAEATLTQAEFAGGQMLPHHYALRMREIGIMTAALTQALTQAQTALNLPEPRA